MATETLYANLSATGGKLIAAANIVLTERATIQQLIDKSAKYEAALKGVRTLNVPYFGTAGVASALTEGTEYTTNRSFSPTAPTLSYAELGIRTVFTDDDFEDSALLQSGLTAANYGWMNDALVVGMESLLAGLFGAFTSNDASTSNTNLGEAAWLDARLKLRKKNVQIKGEPVIGVLNPTQINDFVGDLDTLESYGRIAQNIQDRYAGISGYWDNVFGIMTYESNSVPMVSSNYVGGVFIPSALFFCWKRRPKYRIWEKATGRWTEFQLDMRFLYGIPVDPWGCKLATDA